MRYAIGTPGQLVRVYIDVSDPAIATAQLQKGEILAAVDAAVINATLNADGTLSPPAASDGQ